MTSPSDQNGPRRDPRRLFAPHERLQISAKQGHRCGVCHEELSNLFHVHHKIPWADGGPTHPDNGMAVCPDCHLRAPVNALAVFDPRIWQIEALPAVLAKLRGGEFATVSAAPGAGKTLFAGWVYRNLAVTGDVARVVVFVPNANLRTQWADVVKALNIFLETKGTTEHRNRDGVVLTYHALSDPKQVDQIIADAEATPTLFIFDEVHHLAKGQSGEAGAWAVNTAKIAGTINRPLQRVLNLSGTLFRSKPDEQIATIRYERVGDQIATVADYKVHAGRLIDEKQLRHIKVLGFDAEMKISTVDLAQSAHAHAADIQTVDLDGEKQIRSKVLAGMVRSPRFITGILEETVTRLAHASIALNGAPVKGLVIADGVEHAIQVHEHLVNITAPHMAFIAHGNMSSAESEIQRFRMSTKQAVMVAVQKVTEGFDVPDICVLTYLRTWTAPLFINQMVGRAMRVTDRERETEQVLPATILVPNEDQVKAAFADILVGAMQVLTAEPIPCDYCGREVCVCLPRPRDPKNKICSRCVMPWRDCICVCPICDVSRHHGCRCPRHPSGDPLTVEVMGDGTVRHISVDGHVVDLHLVAALRAGLRCSGLPEIYVEQAASAIQQNMKDDPMSFLAALKGGV
jgi:superfamily II DNA or RNA helicase